MSDLEQIARQVFALKKLSKSTSMSTRRSQNSLVRNLNDQDLTRVAELILRMQEKYLELKVRAEQKANVR